MQRAWELRARRGGREPARRHARRRSCEHHPPSGRRGPRPHQPPRAAGCRGRHPGSRPPRGGAARGLLLGGLVLRGLVLRGLPRGRKSARRLRRPVRAATARARPRQGHREKADSKASRGRAPRHEVRERLRQGQLREQPRARSAAVLPWRRRAEGPRGRPRPRREAVSAGRGPGRSPERPPGGNSAVAERPTLGPRQAERPRVRPRRRCESANAAVRQPERLS